MYKQLNALTTDSQEDLAIAVNLAMLHVQKAMAMSGPVDGSLNTYKVGSLGIIQVNRSKTIANAEVDTYCTIGNEVYVRKSTAFEQASKFARDTFGIGDEKQGADAARKIFEDLMLPRPRAKVASAAPEPAPAPAKPSKAAGKTKKKMPTGITELDIIKLLIHATGSPPQAMAAAAAVDDGDVIKKIDEKIGALEASKKNLLAAQASSASAQVAYNEAIAAASRLVDATDV